MKLGETLKQYVPGKGDQKAKAYEWLEKAGPFEGGPPEAATVISHLSRCLNDNVIGVRFFFSSEVAAKVLLDALGVPDAERPALLELADEMLATGQSRPPKLVLDLTGWPCTGDAATALFEGVKATFLAHTPPRPILLVVTEGQYDRLPRSFDDHGDDLRIERAPAEGEVPLADRAGRSALVASRRRFSPVERWMAIEWRANAFEIEPPAALQTFAENGRLDPLPVVEHVLAAPARLPAKVPPLPADGPALRRLLFALRNAEQAEQLGPAAVRHAWANELGVSATSTIRERIEQEISAAQAALALPVAVASPEELQRMIRKAERQPVPAAALRVGDEIHAINPPEGVESGVAAHPRVRVIRFSPPTPVLTLILDDLRDNPWSYDDLVDDPFLDHFLARWESRGQNPAVVRHAMATLALGDAIKATRAPAQVKDWREALAALLSQDPPAASLLFDGENVNRQDGVDHFQAPQKRVEASNKDISVGARAPLILILANDALVAVRRSQNNHSYRQVRSDRVEMTLDPWAAKDLDRWLKLVEASPACGGSGEVPEGAIEPIQRLSWEANRTSQEIDWPAVERSLAIHWLALRRAIRGGDAVRLPDGSVILHLGASVVAEIVIRHHISRVSSDRQIAAIRRSLHQRSDGPFENDDRIVDRTCRHYESGYAVPRGLYLAAGGFAADIKFRAAPILGALDASDAGRLAATVAIVQDEDD